MTSLCTVWGKTVCSIEQRAGSPTFGFLRSSVGEEYVWRHFLDAARWASTPNLVPLWCTKLMLLRAHSLCALPSTLLLCPPHLFSLVSPFAQPSFFLQLLLLHSFWAPLKLPCMTVLYSLIVPSQVQHGHRLWDSPEHARLLTANNARLCPWSSIHWDEVLSCLH